MTLRELLYEIDMDYRVEVDNGKIKIYLIDKKHLPFDNIETECFCSVGDIIFRTAHLWEMYLISYYRSCISHFGIGDGLKMSWGEIYKSLKQYSDILWGLPLLKNLLNPENVVIEEVNCDMEVI